MRTNPFTDTFLFLIGRTPDHDGSGIGPFLVVLFLVLLAASLWVARRVWNTDPMQHTKEHVATWFMRFMLGCMWFQGSLWKLPLPVSGGLRYWTEEESIYAAFSIHKWIVTNVMLPALPVLNPVVYLTELSLGAAFMLGFFVRPMAIVGILFTLQLWLGLYQHPHEWPWQYMFLCFTMGFFFVTRAGMSLGLDALLAKTGASDKDNAVLKLYRRFA